MEITRLSLQNFRSFEKTDFEFGHRSVVVGPNGGGKSNLLEAVYLLATGKSFKAEREEEMVRYGGDFFTVMGQVGQTGEMRVIWEKKGKRFEINGVAKRMMDFVGKFRAVLFGPQDMELVTGSPGGRRRYLDFVISQADREYRRNLISYERGLRQRNRLLEKIRDEGAGRNQLFFWDKLLIKNGEYITIKRDEYLGKLNNFSVSQFSSVYDRSVISEVRLKQYENEEVAAAATLVGPHRDDFFIQMNGRDVSRYGSRGEQRMAVLWLKNGELDYLTTADELPVLLLDDVFSELDHQHRDFVLKTINNHAGGGGQVIMTTVDEHMMPEGKEWVRIKL